MTHSSKNPREVINVSARIVRSDQVGRAIVSSQANGKLVRKELGHGLDSRSRRPLRDLRCGIDSEHPRASVQEETKTRTIVRADVCDERAPVESEPVDHLRRVRTKVLDELR